MRPLTHVAASLTGAGLLLGLTGSWRAALASCLTGMFLDLDHLAEFLAARRPLTLSAFMRFWQTFWEPRLYLWAHAWEWLLLLAAAAALGWLPWLTGGLAFGLGHHLLLDQFGNGVRPGAYLLGYRWRHGFRTERILLGPAYWPGQGAGTGFSSPNRPDRLQ